MVEKDTSDPGEGSSSCSEAQNFAVMFKSVMNEMKVGSKLLAEIVQDLNIEEKTGNDVDEGLVKLLNGLLKDKLQEDKVQTPIDKYPWPGSVEGLRTLRVNPLIWNQKPPQACTSDLKSQK